MAVSTAGAVSVRAVQTYDRNRIRIAAALTLLLGLGGGLVAGAVSDGRSATSIVLVVAAVLPLVWWTAPQFGVFFLVGAATLVEQFRYSIGTTGLDAFTDRIPLFASLQGGEGFSGLPMSPIDIAIILLLLVWLTRCANERKLDLPRTQVALLLAAVLALVAVALVRGLGLGGDNTRAALWELRPWLYLAVSFVFAARFLNTRRAIDGVLWLFVIGSGFKALQGVYIFAQTANMNPRPEAILGHEESFFFGIFVILTAALWIFRRRGALRVTATTILPLVLVADMGNSRRDAFVILGAGLLVLTVLAYVVMPERRRGIAAVAAGVALVGVGYTAVMWNGNGLVAEPARALKSVIAPDPRDALSNQYRVEEDANLGYMIQDAAIVGTGFGVPINYGRVAIVNIQNVDSFIDWVPHNGVLYVWMRMGLAGELALWLFVAAVVAMGVRAARSPNRDTAILGALVACAGVAWVTMGYTDMGFFWFRIAIAFGILLGVLHAAMRLDRQKAARPAQR